MNMVTVFDYIIVGLFFIIVFAIGLYERKKLTIEDYWVNNRNTGKFTLVATTLSTFVGAGAILGNAGIAYSGAGLAAFVIAGSYFFYFLIFSLFFAPKIKEFGDVTKSYSLPDYLGVRYSNRVRVAGTMVNLVTWSLYLAVQMLAFGVFVGTLTGLSATTATILGGVVVIVYTTIGGLRADIRTDVFQFFIMLFLLLLFLPTVIHQGGGFTAILTLPHNFLIGSDFAPPYVMALAFFFLGAGVLVSADMWQRAYASDTKNNVRRAMKVASFMVLAFLSMATLFGIFGKILLPDGNANYIIAELLVLLLPTGLIGIVLAGFFAAIMSSADSVLLVMSTTIVHDVFQNTFKKNFSNEKLLRVSRWTTFLSGLVGLVVALIIFNIVHLSIEAVSFYLALLPAIVFGFYWKKGNEIAAFWSIILGFITIVLFIFIDPVQAFIPGLIVSFITYLAMVYFTQTNISLVKHSETTDTA